IPALGKHSDAHDAAYVAARRVQWPVQLVGKVLETFGVNRATLLVPSPVCLAHGIEGNAHPSRLIVLCLTCISFVNYLGIDADRVDLSVPIPESFDLRWWNTRGRFAVR